VRYQTEVERLRDEVESGALERGREEAARADASRELAAALERVSERDRALHGRAVQVDPRLIPG